MSDKLDEIDKLYRKDVLPDDVPKKFALFSIPEYPELESGEGMWAVCVDALLTALRYLAPVTLITLFWGQQSFLFRILRHIDLAFRAIIFSNEEQKQSVLKWLSETGPVKVEHLDTVWRHGWVLCGVLDAAMPGACAGHPATRQTLKHAQTIADHYLGVDPVFSREELESECLSKHEEWKLAHYLDRIRLALAKVPPPVSKPVSQRTSPEAMQFTLDYVARGSGLAAAQINHMMYFKIYPTAQQSLEPGEITVLIRGPKDTYGMVVIPPLLGKPQMIRQKLLNLQTTRHYTENVLPITQGATYLRTYGRTDMNKTYHIPKTKYDIEMNVESHEEYAKVGYVANLEGKYEISIVSRGRSIVGSPFAMLASNNIVGTLERESFCLEDGEEIDIIDAKTERKVVLRIVDFVTEKMLLNENGTLQKISSDDANILMATDEAQTSMTRKVIKSDLSSPEHNHDVDTKKMTSVKVGRLKEVAKQIKSLVIACKAFYESIQVEKSEKQKIIRDESYLRSHSRQGIPDVVNSTLNDSITYPCSKREVSEVIQKTDYSTSIRTKSNTIYEDIAAGPLVKNIYRNNAKSGFNHTGSGSVCNTSTRVNNPFLEVYEEGSSLNMTRNGDDIEEDPTHIYEIESIDALPIKITIQEDDDESVSPTTNPFIEPELLERPKTPVLKIITGEVKDRVDGVYVDPHIEQLTEDILGNEFINPFFMHQHIALSEHGEQEPVTTFIIGAPVTLPPIVTASSSDPDMSSIMITSSEKCCFSNEVNENRQMKSSESVELSPSVFSTPLHAKLGQNSIASSTFYSLDSNLNFGTEKVLISDSGFEISPLQSPTTKEPSKRDTWDSAYVSIDENNSSPDSNNNDNALLCDAPIKSKFSPSEDITLKKEDLINMGPAEKEIWSSCAELNCIIPNRTEELKLPRWEKRPIFTPIIEESERSMSGNIRESGRSSKQNEIDPVTMAFAELNDIFQEYNSTSEQSSLTTSGDYILDHNNDLEYTTETNYIRVKSASECVSDVIRPTSLQKEGEISEVQPYVTESFSASQTLPLKSDTFDLIKYNTQNQTKFGGEKQTNIVIEKKKYWDERIREIEETRSEQTKKKRLLSKNLRHNDSLSKRRGKQILKNVLLASETCTTPVAKVPENPVRYGPLPISATESSDVKLVEKWRKYWDDKLETEKDAAPVGCFGATLYRGKREKSLTPESAIKNVNNKTVSSFNIQPQSESEDGINVSKEFTDNVKIETSNLSKHFHIKSEEKQSNLENTARYLEHRPHTIKELINTNETSSNSTLSAKQELPEELFKAFETSPKRFFGTSRKQILNKIDAFLGKPSTTDEKIIGSEDKGGAFHDKGLVSSRISLYHNISHVEDLPWKCSKSTSMLNLRQRKDSENTHSETLKKSYAEGIVEKGFNVTSDNDISNSVKQEQICKSNSMLQFTKCMSSGKNVNPLKSSNKYHGNVTIAEQGHRVQEQIKAYSTEISNSMFKNQWKSNKSKSMNNIWQCKDPKPVSYISKLSGKAPKKTMLREREPYNVDTENLPLRNIKTVRTNLERDKSVADTSVFTDKTAVSISTSVPERSVQTAVKYIDRPNHKAPKINNLQKSTVSKSELDIFGKITSIDVSDDLDKHKSYEALPKANVRNFINMYETVSKTAKLDETSTRNLSRTSSVGSEQLEQIISSITGTTASNQTLVDDSVNALQRKEELIILPDLESDTPIPASRKRHSAKLSEEKLDLCNSTESKYEEFQNNNNSTRKERYISLSDIEVEIIENDAKTTSDSQKENILKIGTKRDNMERNKKTDPVDYKSRFKLAKQYFQSLEELRAENKTQLKLNECEQLLLKESLVNKTNPPQRLKKNKKSRSMDSSELAKVWRQMEERSNGSEQRFVKISEKFHVEDLFTDVTEGKLSRQGSLRGIPHKKAVLEAFRSMENVSDTKLSSYEIAVSHLTDFAKENKIKNAQTYLTEYPYLPMTEPSKYHSRLDIKASGLVSMKELTNNRPRRNSVPDMRINPMFIADV